MLWEPSDLHLFIYEDLHLRIRRKICLVSNQNQIYNIPTIHRRHWIESESELRQFMDQINKKKHQSMKFDFKFSKESIKYLDTLV